MTSRLPKKTAFRQGYVVRYGVIVLLFIAPSLVADKDSLFADDSEEIPIIPIEVDPDFEDDFAHIEMGPGMQASGGPYQAGFLITDSYDLFSGQDLVRREKSISVFGGNEAIASRYHFTLFPQGRFEVWRLFGHLGVPLRFPVYDKVKKDTIGMRGRGFVDGETFITPRTADFRSAWDIQRVIRHFEINKATDPYFFRLSRSHSITLGHGELVRNMMPEGLYDHDTLFLSGHAYFEAAHLEAFAAPVFKTSIAGLSVRFTPLSMINAPAWVRDMNFDVSYVGDFAAPNYAQLHQDSFVLDKERRLVKREKGLAQGFVLGVAEEFHPWSWLNLKPYISWGNLWLSGLKNKEGDAPSSYGVGMHVGHEATFSFLPNKRSVLLFKSEGRLFSKNYYPGYFGSTYLIDRQQFNEPKDKSTEPITKSQYVNAGGDQYARFGYLFELGYAYEDAFSTILSYENARSFAQASIIPPSRKLQFITTILGLDAVKVYLGYQATALADFKELFDFDKSRALLSLRGQLKLLPFLYFDTWAKHSFGIYDMFSPSTTEGQAEPLWLSNLAETRSLNFGLGFEFAMTF